MHNPAAYSLTETALSPAWRRLRLFNYYRGVLALFFLTIYLNGWAELLIPPHEYSPKLFATTTILYIIAFVVFLPSIHQQRPALEIQAIIHTCIDIVAILALMHASGGVRSGLGMLLIISISMTSLFLPQRITLFFAAAATIAILVEQASSQILAGFTNAIAQAGFLGMLIFAFAIMSSKIAVQLRESERLASEQSRELESAVQMNEHIIRNMRTGIMVVTPEGAIQMANNAAENLLGNQKLSPGLSLAQVAPALYQRFSEWQQSTEMGQQQPVPQSHGLPDLQPGFSPIDPERGRKGRTLVFLEDATQLNQRFQQVKLASLGRLTASIAHEIRNPLAAIHHASQLLDEAMVEPADAKLTKIISTQVKRLNAVVENVLQLSRQQYGTPDSIELSRWLAQFRDEFCTSHALGREQIVIDIHPENTRIRFDPNHLHQVFWNLCSNAMHHAGVDTANLVISVQGGMSRDSTLPFVDIIDNGRGIDDDVEKQIFEPFFTTSNEGTGLGLYITKEVIENNRAKIMHISPPAGGTCFRIYFMPAPDAAAANDIPAAGRIHPS